MIPLRDYLSWLAVTVLFTWTVTAHEGLADVEVFDTIGQVNQDVMLKVQTRGRFFPEGGKMVELSVDGVSLKRNLTGGDGYGYFKYRPASSGLKKIEAKSGEDTAEGWLLVFANQQKAVIVEVEGALKESLFADTPVENSLESIKKLSKKYHIIYLTRLPFFSYNRQWLKKNDFPQYPLLYWENGYVFRELEEKQVDISAVIASLVVLEETPDTVEHQFSFEEGKDDFHVESWEEISF